MISRPILRTSIIPKTEYPILKNRYYNGETFEEIGKSYGVSKRCISIIFQKLGWPARSGREAQVHDRFSEANILKYKTWYLAGNGGIWKTAEIFHISPLPLISIAREQGWLIENYQHVMYEKPVGWASSSTRSMLKRLEEASVTRPYCLGHYREIVTGITKRVVKIYGGAIHGVGNSIDHVYPVSRAFYGMDNIHNPCSILELCHPANLEFIDMRLNSKKHKNLTKSIDATRQSILEWDEIHGSPWQHPNLSDEAKRRIND